jgi:hypothetical protein
MVCPGRSAPDTATVSVSSTCRHIPRAQLTLQLKLRYDERKLAHTNYFAAPYAVQPLGLCQHGVCSVPTLVLCAKAAGLPYPRRLCWRRGAVCSCCRGGRHLQHDAAQLQRWRAATTSGSEGEGCLNKTTMCPLRALPGT